MIEKKENIPEEIISVEKQGKFKDLTKKEFKEKLIVENLIGRASKARTFKTYLISLIKVAKADKNLDLQKLLEDLLLKFISYETVSKVKLKGWKGKSSINIIKRPDRIIVITFQKEDQDSEAHEVKTEISKEELNNLIISFNRFEPKKKIDTKEIAEAYCRISNIREDNERRPLFENGKFIYKAFFAWRYAHIRLNLMMRVLDLEGVIRYRGRKIEIINEKMDIQEILT